MHGEGRFRDLDGLDALCVCDMMFSLVAVCREACDSESIRIRVSASL